MFNETLRAILSLTFSLECHRVFVGEMDLRIFIASLQLSMKDLSGEHENVNYLS